ncbi:hemolysin III family protein [Bacillus licheniformis]|jgi:hemolysin III|uniref:Membrane protein, Hemolysin III homolog n=6 Tax=Bacillus TaxID=1386 RepID=Q65IB7_BACLD|nr:MULTISPECIES: hemolysin III family protein [Bacillus]MBJ7885162.1 hemolysin III family protein [Bacillaceae bacterium HSR45]MBY8346903.1 hemolysin III family protein [Bacillus sp. PCH94]MDP4079653.1 hemolysin III family protein [Bacillota bacterium]AAU23841.1 putative membrane protein, Hemolysin III homolog [Bacillus licheniformis DSM 13 = ATCC 14580]AAU41197.1 hemolysin-3-like protein [Bacillus licheniformis DSM 13 = ATCC 14580]
MYTIKEEIANAITHGLGVLLSIPAIVFLVIFAIRYGSPVDVVSFSIFGASMLFLYLSSTLLHSIQHQKTKDILEIIDHSAIYVLIAGTYTPLLLGPLKGALGYTMLAVVWGLAIGGVVFKIFFVKRFIVVSTLVYLVMGWMAIIAIKPLYTALTGEGFALLLLGGILYSVGTIFYLWRKIPYHHAIWHTFVLGGSASMFFCVLFYVAKVPFVS